MLDIKIILKRNDEMLKLADTVSIKQDETYYIFFDNETGDIYKLNEISYKILSLCDGSTTNEDILSTIMPEFLRTSAHHTPFS